MVVPFTADLNCEACTIFVVSTPCSASATLLGTTVRILIVCLFLKVSQKCKSFLSTF